MLNLDPSKLLIIAVVAVILLGPDRLPAFARQVGGAWKTFTAYRHRMESQVRESIPDLPSTSEIGRLARSPAAFLNHLSTLSPDEAEPVSTGNDGTESAADFMTRAAAAYRPDEPLPARAVPPVPLAQGADPGLN
jgi:Sec-independent protein translocase protein TatA